MNTIKLGSKGDDVKLLQKYLGVTVDGNFGPITDRKVREWQKANDLLPDGIIGPKSWSIILGETSNKNGIGISNGMINFICQWETSHSFGYKMGAKDLNGIDLKDAGGHKTFGYGLLVHPNGKYMDSIKKTWTQKELEDLFIQHAKQISSKIDNWTSLNKIKLNQNQKDAIASACYNFGTGFLTNKGKVYSSVVNMIIKNPNNPEIEAKWAAMSNAQAKKYPGLAKRRYAEAKWYFGKY